MLVISAGSLMHLLIAIVLLFGIYATRGELVERPGAEIGVVEGGGPAQTAGIESGDVVVSIGGEVIDDPDDLGETVRSHEPGDSVAIVVERDGEQQTVTAVLGANTEQGSELFGSARLGVSSRTAAEWDEMSVGDAAASSVTDLIPVTWESTKGIVQVLNPVNIVNHLSGESEDLTTRPTTVVGVTQVSGTVGETEGFVGVLYLLAVLNVFVGVFNMFPLLPLDGGHAAVATYERLRERGGRRYFADVSRLMPFAMGVIMVLLALFVSGLYLDITQPLR
jgi:membrane-associated protease RseP (regulator of RpoE activity)